MPEFRISTAPEPQRPRSNGNHDRQTTPEMQDAASAMYVGPRNTAYGKPNDVVRLKDCVECKREPHVRHWDSATRNPMLNCDACGTITWHRHQEDRIRTFVGKGEVEHIYECKVCQARRRWGVSVV